MEKRKLVVYGVGLLLIQLIMGLKIFVTFPDMQAYAAPQKEMDTIQKQLARIETKLDKLILGY